MGIIKKFQCPHCQGIVELEFNDEYVICGHCDTAVQVPKEFGPGVVIDDFIVLSLLGEGGMGNVYLAHQYSLDRKVALKILKDDFLKDPKFKDEFIYEARSVACLNHPNIIQAYKVGEEDGIVFFAMEYVEGRNLKDILKEEGAISEKLAISIAMEIVAALGYGWNLRKLVHRDIKPENIMMTNDGTAKLMDLGLSLRDGDDKDEGDMIAGTPQYISPEQVLGTDMDIRGDFYCLGATLYHLVSGKMPFEGNLQQIVKQHLSDKPQSLRKVVPGIDDFFAKIIHKMMSKKPENRYESADALLAAFRKDMKLIEDAEHGKKHFKISTQTNILSKTSTSEFSKRKKKKDPLLLASVIMIGLLVGGFLIVKLLMGGSKTPAVTTTQKNNNTGNSGSKAPVTNKGTVTEISPVQGLSFKYFHTKDHKASNPFQVGVLKETGVTNKFFINAPDGKQNQYSIIFEGFINIEFTESYRFYVKADDLCNIKINDTWITGQSGKEVSKTVPLDKGVHPITIYYAQKTGSKYMDIQVESVSFNRKKIPMEWFTLTPGTSELVYNKSKTGINYRLYRDMADQFQYVKQFADEEGLMSKVQSFDQVKKGEKYVLWFDGLFKVPKPGKYKIYITSHSRKILSINSVELINTDYQEKTSTTELDLKNTVNMLEVRTFLSGGHNNLLLEIEGEGLERQEIPESWYFQQLNSGFWDRLRKKEIAAVRNEHNKGRLNYKYFDKKLNVMSNMRTAKQTSTGTHVNLTSRKGKKSTEYSLYFYGNIKIPGTDIYKFTLDSDDESELLINGKKVSTDKAGNSSNPGEIHLTKGEHKFEVFYKQGVHDRHLKLYVESSKLSKIRVPSSWFTTSETVSKAIPSAPPTAKKDDKTETKNLSKTIVVGPSQTDDKGKFEEGLKYTLYKSDKALSNLAQMLKSKKVKTDELAGNINLNEQANGFKENFGLVYEGYLKVAKEGEKKFRLRSNDDTKLYIGGKLIIDNAESRDSENPKYASVKMSPGLHLFKLVYYQDHKGMLLSLKWENEAGNYVFIHTHKLRRPILRVDERTINPVASDKDESFEPGLRYTLHKSGTEVENMDEMLKNNVQKKDILCKYFKHDAHAGSHDKNYGLVYEGYIFLDVDKTHTFGLTSNDGSRLYLDDKLVIDNDGTHEAIEKQATLKLKKGLYKFRLEYFQQLMARELKFTWKNKSGKMVPVQERAFYRKK